MNYSLGNMLSRGGALNPDGLSLDLAFATDKTLTARKGPTPTFTRASTATFVGSDGLIQSAAINAPRFDHDPVTLACKGLLIEESRTNNITHSEDMTVANGWTQDTGTGTVAWVNNATTSPSGITTAEKLTEASTTTSRKITIKLVPVVTGITYTISVFAKAAERSFLQICVGTGFTAVEMNFDLVNGVTGSGSATNAKIDNMGDGWWRCSMNVTASITSPNAIITLGIVPLATSIRFQSYAGVVGDGIYLWGAQLEAGSFPTSYIPTTTAALTRSADVCSISGTNFTGFWNQSAGTLVQVFEASPNTNTTYVSASNGNIAANSVHIDNDTGLMRSVYYSGSSIVATLNLGAVGTVGSVNKVATAYSVNDFAASRNGGSAVTNTSGALPIGLSQMNIGTDERSQVPTSFFSNKCISSLRYYNKRLPNAKLQSLTT